MLYSLLVSYYAFENSSLNKNGAVIIVGPASYLNPFTLKNWALPPKLLHLSINSTGISFFLTSLIAEAIPPKPAPITIAFFILFNIEKKCPTYKKQGI